MSMAASWYHCSVKPVSRSAGRSVVAAAAYRLGERLHDEVSAQVHDYTRRSGVEAKFTVAPIDAPAWAHDPERLWNAAERAEKRINSTLAREVELALPAIISPEARQGITEAFAEELVGRYGVAVSVAIHTPSRHGDQRNTHAHILFTTREMTPEGLGKKTRILDDRKTGPAEVSHLRAYACDLINQALADGGSDERVDHRSFKERGIDREPTQHLGPVASEIERRGEASERGDHNRAILAGSNQLAAWVEELASIDAAIALEQARQLEEQHPDPAPEDPAPSSLEDLPGDFGEIHRATVALAQEIVPAELPDVTPAPADDFAAVHHRTIARANANQAMLAREEAEEPGGRFTRLRAWWGNMREHFTEWREQLFDRFEGYPSRGDLSPEAQPDMEHDR
jgi:hypothetical protein